MMGFQTMGLGRELTEALQKEGITEPMPAQEKVFGAIMEGRSLALQSETGSGKTLAYLLPIMQRLLGQEGGNKVLILVPTHELAIQVTDQAKRLSRAMSADILTVPIVGNVNIKRQTENLKAKPQIIVGTTGRMLELMQKKKIAAHLIQTVIVDEADKMLEKQQAEETNAVIKKCMRDVQKLFFSASLPKEAAEKMQELTADVEIMHMEKQMTIPKGIHHLYIICERRDKIKVLRSVISATNPKKAMVFINRAYDIEEATQRLCHHHYQAACIHGSEHKEQRKKVVEQFRSGKLRILIGTDMAARGLHFDGVDEVIHYSISENPKDYLHRAGRTGRNGREGMSISIVTERELPLMKACERKFNITMQECILSKGMLMPAAEKKQASGKTSSKNKYDSKYKAGTSRKDKSSHKIKPQHIKAKQSMKQKHPAKKQKENNG